MLENAVTILAVLGIPAIILFILVEFALAQKLMLDITLLKRQLTASGRSFSEIPRNNGQSEQIMPRPTMAERLVQVMNRMRTEKITITSKSLSTTLGEKEANIQPALKRHPDIFIKYGEEWGLVEWLKMTQNKV